MKDLRESMKISDKYNDKDIVCKYGKTVDLYSRTNQHGCNYGKIKGVNLSLKYYQYIDIEYLYKAEKGVKRCFYKNDGRKEDMFSYNESIEIVIISKKKLKEIERDEKGIL